MFTCTFYLDRKEIPKCLLVATLLLFKIIFSVLSLTLLFPCVARSINQDKCALSYVEIHGIFCGC